ncbi:HNH endonuclease signature motif containing protein [Pseudarthrobacter sp. NS4]|uniref:HNH endonuclease signature motif containing protein n=1 Tax=Pseudarthrobacter sp. NS4 TaxID=2973976 RepID=UPI002161B09B|nr:HNH endonuclease signature motif containing protein [Pseudarthrobacter sp. NS4]
MIQRLQLSYTNNLTPPLEAQVAAIKAWDAAESIELHQAMTPPEASAQDRAYGEMSAVEEIAGVLTISSGAAGAFVHQSRRLCSLPPALDALASGAVSWQHARIIADETEGLGPAGAAALVAHFLDPDAPNPARGAAPGELVPSRFRAKVRTWRERHHPESLEKRHTKAVTDRRVEHCPDRDGTAWISAYLPADTASAIWNRTNALARGKQGPDETRTLTQLRADEFATMLLRPGPALNARAGESGPRGGERGSDDMIGLASLAGAGDVHENPGPDCAAGTAGNGARPNPGKVPAPRADVLVTVPVFSLLGLTDEPAILDGHGPIPASMARKLVTDGTNSFYRVLVDPRDGAPLEIGRKNYRLPEAVKRWLRMRDGKYTFPGCTNHTLDNETDHLLAWHHGGTTGVSNLGQACPKHHRLKHASTWTPTPATKNEPPGWTSPTGRHYTSEHQDREPPHWPASLSELWPESDSADLDGVFNLDFPEAFAMPNGLELPEDLDVPEDPWVPESELPRDPFPDWQLWGAFDECNA